MANKPTEAEVQKGKEDQAYMISMLKSRDYLKSHAAHQGIITVARKHGISADELYKMFIEDDGKNNKQSNFFIRLLNWLRSKLGLSRT